VFFILAMTYFVVCWSLTELAKWLERRIARKRLGAAAAAHADVLDDLPPTVATNS
jgi:polar amino acid transport system permease protein